MQKNIMPKHIVDKIFSHVPAIYSFHSSFLLPQLKERLENWYALKLTTVYFLELITYL